MVSVNTVARFATGSVRIDSMPDAETEVKVVVEVVLLVAEAELLEPFCRCGSDVVDDEPPHAASKADTTIAGTANVKKGRRMRKMVALSARARHAPHAYAA